MGARHCCSGHDPSFQWQPSFNHHNHSMFHVWVLVPYLLRHKNIMLRTCTRVLLMILMLLQSRTMILRDLSCFMSQRWFRHLKKEGFMPLAMSSLTRSLPVWRWELWDLILFIPKVCLGVHFKDVGMFLGCGFWFQPITKSFFYLKCWECCYRCSYAMSWIIFPNLHQWR